MKNGLNNRPKTFHVCRVCGKIFDRPSSFAKHERIHTGHRPWTCSVCLKKFSQTSSLYRHMRMCHGNFKKEKTAN